MNCRQAKFEMALCVGEDLTDADRREKLRGHLTGCPDCRAHLKRLKGMFQVIEQAEGQQTYDSADSLWPRLAGRLGRPRPRMHGPRFNGWVPFSVMAAACALLMLVMEMQPSTAGTPVSGSLLRGFLWPGAATTEERPAEVPETDDKLVSPADSAVFGPAPDRPPALTKDSTPTSSF